MKRRLAELLLLSAAVLVAALAVGASATPVAAQGTVAIDAPDEVEAGGEFEFTVTMETSSVGEVAVDSSDLGVELSVVDDAGDSTGAQTETSVEFIDIDAGDSTYVLNADVTDGTGGDTGTITAATGDNIGGPEVDDSATATFRIASGGGTSDDSNADEDGGEDGQETTDGGTEDGTEDGSGDGQDTDETTDEDGAEDGTDDGSQDGQDTDGTQTQDSDEEGDGQQSDRTQDGGEQSSDGTGDGDGQASDGTEDGGTGETEDGTGDEGPEEGLPGFTPTTGLMVVALLAFVLLALRYRG